MKTTITLLALISMTFLGACQFSGQSPVSPSRETFQGPSDGGGGDTCNGKMIESYKVDITELEEFKEYIQPIMEKLHSKKDDKAENAGSPFSFTPKMKNWYIIDCKLQDIPKERKGLYLESYQTAIHTSREIFIDSTSYGKMTKAEKAKLLLHEMVMSYYLMKYLSIEDICKLSWTCTSDVTVVSKWKMYRPLPYRPLNDEDHQKIRSVTAWLWSQGDALSSENFKKILTNNDFDNRFSYVNDDIDAKEFQVDPQVLVRMFKKHQWSQSFPKFCQFNETTQLSQSACKTEVTADIRDFNYSGVTLKQLYVKLRLTRLSDQKIIEKEFSYPLMTTTTKISLFENRFGSILKAVPMFILGNWPNHPGVTTAEGLQSSSLFLMMNFADRENPEIFQMMVQSYVWYSFEEVIVERDGGKYKELYGYISPIEDDRETLFIENELPFTFRAALPSREFIKSEHIP